MSYKIYIPIDSTALSLGADDVYKTIQDEASQRKINLQIVRNGSHSILIQLYWPQMSCF